MAQGGPYQVLGKEEQVDNLIHDLQADIESMSSGVESPPSTIVAATIKNAAQQVTFEDSAESRWENLESAASGQPNRQESRISGPSLITKQSEKCNGRVCILNALL